MRMMLTLLSIAILELALGASELNGKVLEGGVARSNALVCVRGDPPIKKQSAGAVIWSIQNRKLIPRIMVATQGQEIIVWNSDATLATVMFSVRNNKKQNKTLAAGGRLTFAFDQPETFSMVYLDDGLSDVGYLCVVGAEVTAFTLTDAKGSFVIPDLPPGRYSVEAVTMRRQKSSQTLEMGDQPASLTFNLQPPGL